MEFENSNHSAFLLCGMNQLRIQNQLCDVVLTVSKNTLQAHKNVLSICSPFFAAMFNGSYAESNQREVHLQNMDGETFQLILNYMYTGQLKINQANVQNLLEISTFFQIEWIQKKCCQFLENILEPNNCLGIKNLAESHSLVNLGMIATQYAVEHFNQVSEIEEFLSIKFEELIEIVSHDNIFNHEEDVIFSGIMKWITYAEDKRSSFLPNLLEYIHPALVSKNLVEQNNVLMKDSSCSDWVSRALDQNNYSEWNIFLLDKIGNSSDAFRYELKSNQLISLTSLPEKAFAFSLVGNKHSLYTLGGAIHRISTRSCYHYNIYHDKWTQFTPLNTARSHHRSVVLNNYIYALGGSGVDRGPLSSVECLDLTTGEAVMIESMLDKRTSMGAVAHENCVYVMGGENRQECLFSVERYDVREGVWVELQSMNQVNSYCSSAIVADGIYCSEGLGNYMERYDFRACQWHLIEFQENREFYELFSINDKLHSVCGSGIYCYCPISNEWLTVFEFPVAREWDTAVPLQI